MKGPWKKKSLSDLGVVTQCISPDKIDDEYLTNVILKINSKVIQKLKVSSNHFITYFVHSYDTFQSFL